MAFFFLSKQEGKKTKKKEKRKMEKRISPAALSLPTLPATLYLSPAGIGRRKEVTEKKKKGRKRQAHGVTVPLFIVPLTRLAVGTGRKEKEMWEKEKTRGKRKEKGFIADTGDLPSILKRKKKGLRGKRTTPKEDGGVQVNLDQLRSGLIPT